MKNDFSILPRIWKHLSIRRRKQIFYLNLIIVFAGIAELFSVASFIPFLNLLTNSSNTKQLPLMKNFYTYFQGLQVIDPFLLTLITFLIFISAAGIFRLISIFGIQYISAGIGSDFTYKAYKLSLNQPYSVHLSRNSSEILSSIISQTDRSVFAIQSILNLSSSLVISFALISSLFLINWVITLSITIFFTSLYLFLALILKIRLNKISKLKAKLTNLQTKSLQEGLGSIRDIILDNSQKYFINIFHLSDKQLRFIEAKSQFIAASPKYIFEILTLYLITLLAFIFSKSSSYGYTIIPILGSIILGIQRLLPAFQLGYNSWVNMTINFNSVNNLLSLLEQEPGKTSNDKNKLILKKYICLDKVDFAYFKKSKKVLKEFNLTIYKGETIGIVGPSGSGKSTIANLLMGLLKPNKGSLIIDGINIHADTVFTRQDWYKNISHVPQDIYLADGSIAENIAFGIDSNKIDNLRLMRAINSASISDLVRNVSSAYKTKVGERGIQLSGGQKQRIGIARALYKGGNVLVLDEATSSLDQKTEADIMKTINNLSKDITVIIITHRLSNLSFCDRVIKMKTK